MGVPCASKNLSSFHPPKNKTTKNNTKRAWKHAALAAQVALPPASIHLVDIVDDICKRPRGLRRAMMSSHANTAGMQLQLVLVLGHVLVHHLALNCKQKIFNT